MDAQGDQAKSTDSEVPTFQGPIVRLEFPTIWGVDIKYDTMIGETFRFSNSRLPYRANLSRSS